MFLEVRAPSVNGPLAFPDLLMLIPRTLSQPLPIPGFIKHFLISTKSGGSTVSQTQLQEQGEPGLGSVCLLPTCLALDT